MRSLCPDCLDDTWPALGSDSLFIKSKVHPNEDTIRCRREVRMQVPVSSGVGDFELVFVSPGAADSGLE